MKPFVHLHNHTAYSLLDGAGKITDQVARAKELGMPALAITDHGTMYGVVDFYKACKAAGIKPIIGCEVYVAPRSRSQKQAGIDDAPYHLILLVKNETGYRNLIKLVSLASLEGFYYRPRVDRELLSQYHDGLIALSACMGGELPRKIMAEDFAGAREAALWYQHTFGSENYFFEIQNHFFPEQMKINQGLAALGKELHIPLVASNDNHYVYKEDAHIQDVMMCIQTGKTLDDNQRMRFEGEEFYLKSYAEMAQVLGEYPEALDMTVQIAEMCDFDFVFGVNHLPLFTTPHGETLEAYLEALCQEGLQMRYGTPTAEAQERLRFELDTLNAMGYAGYFLIVWDFIRYAREKGIYVGPGRGSAAGSLVSYVLRITDIDPLAYQLLFERFLNPERVNMPDIDIDFCYERRNEVIEYVVEKYGSDHVSQIITFGTMAAKGAIRDVGRVMDIPIAVVNKIAKLIPNELGITLEKAVQVSPDLRQAMADDPQINTLIATAQKLEGLPRHAGTHAAGVVIAQEPIDHYVPLQKTNDGFVITQFAKENVEEMGLLKMDFLGLRTLTVINKAIEDVYKNYGILVDFDHIDVNDPGSYELLSAGESIGIFQLESSGLRALLKELKPTQLEDVIALVALYRPGPLGSGMADDFIERKHGRKEITYLHPSLAGILKPTYGVILYQEQVMQIASRLAGFSLGEADLLRRAMGKKKPEIIASLKQQFVQGALQNAIDEQTATSIFELIEFFAGYGFNKSHSAAYAVLAFQTAYLKRHYPKEFMAALLTSIMDTADRVPFYVEECRKMGIAVLPPDVNESGSVFQTTPQGIRFGLAAVKGVGASPIEAIITSRDADGPFLSLQDFCMRVDMRLVNRRAMENLIKCGAFSFLEAKKCQLLAILDTCIEQGQTAQKNQNSDQLSIFDFAEEIGFAKSFAQVPLPNCEEFSSATILSMEKDILGLYVSGHPLDDYRNELAERASYAIVDLKEEMDNQQMILGGILSHVKVSTTRKGDMMAYLTLEDLSGQIEVLVFPRTFVANRALLVQDDLMYIKGRLNYQEDEPKFFAEEFYKMGAPAVAPGGDYKATAAQATVKVFLKIQHHPDDRSFAKSLTDGLKTVPGKVPVYCYYPDHNKLILLDDGYWVEESAAFYRIVSNLIGAENISIKEEQPS